MFVGGLGNNRSREAVSKPRPMNELLSIMRLRRGLGGGYRRGDADSPVDGVD